VTRVLSALVLLPAVLGIVWFLPPIYTTILIGIIVALAFDEYARMARLGSQGFPWAIAGVATLAAYVAVWAGMPLAQVFAPALLVGAVAAVGRGRPDEDAVRLAAVTLFPLLYLAVPLGMAAALHTDRGPLTLLVPFLVVVASDSAQYYGGRTMGRRPLAPRISPKKTVEGAITGVVVAAAVTPLHQGFVEPDPGARRHPGSHRRAAVRVPGLRAVPASGRALDRWLPLPCASRSSARPARSAAVRSPSSTRTRIASR
jgi:CDP-diglyceride synthetase